VLKHPETLVNSSVTITCQIARRVIDPDNKIEQQYEMATKLKSSFKSWMVLYIGLAVAMLVTGPPNESAQQLVSPGSFPSAVTADREFFVPITSLIPRKDI